MMSIKTRSLEGGVLTTAELVHFSLFPTWTNLEPHVSHLYGFSPEWMRVWVLRLAGRLNWAPQMLQWYGFAPEVKISGQQSHAGSQTCSYSEESFILPV